MCIYIYTYYIYIYYIHTYIHTYTYTYTYTCTYTYTLHTHTHTHIHIHIHIHLRRHYLSSATCLIRPRLFYALFIVSRTTVILPQSSPLLKNTCVRQVALDKRFPLILSPALLSNIILSKLYY